MKVLEYIVGFVMTAALVLVLLITSVEAVVYWNPGYFETEYKSYGAAESVEMDMEDLLHVTDEMMAYLRGEREELQVQTVVAGQPRGFFSAREIAHMADVRELFLGGMAVRRGAASVLVLCGVWLCWRRRLSLLPKTMIFGIAGILGVCAVCGLIVSLDFNKYFTLFHHIFFDNDLWILNPTEDLLIRIVPEQFFMETALRIGLTFGVGLILVLAVCTWLVVRKRQKRRSE